MPHPMTNQEGGEKPQALSSLQQVLVDFMRRHIGDSPAWTARDVGYFIGRQPGHEGDAQHSRLISRELRALEKLGYVTRADAKSPVAWRAA